MAASIFSLFGEIFVDNTQANKNIDSTTSKGETLGTKFGGALSTVGKVAAGIGVAAAAAGTAIFAMADKSAQATDEIDKQRQALGMSVEGYQEWAYVLGQNGADITQMGTAMKTLSGVMDGSSKAGVAAMDALGISFQGLNQEEAFSTAVTALQGVSDETEKARLAQDLFGKKYQDLMPLLNQTAAGTDDLTNRAHELGLVLGEDAVSAGVTFGDTLDDLKQSVTAMGTQLGTSVMPILTEGMNYIISLLPMILPFIQQLAPMLQGMMAAILPVLMQVVQDIMPSLLTLITSLMPLISTLISSVLPPILDIITLLAPYLVQIVSEIVPILVDLLNTLMPIIMPLIEAFLPVLMSLLQMILDPLMQLLDFIIPPLTTVISFLAKIISGALSSAFSSIIDIAGNVKRHFELIIDFFKNVFTGNWKAAWQDVKDIFANIWDGIKNAVKAPVNYIIGAINGLIKGLNNIKVPDWVPLIGGKGISISQIPLLAAGGDIVGSGAAIVGEAGPELLNLPQGAQVTPLNKAGLSITIDHPTVMRPADIDWLMDLVVVRLKQMGVSPA